MARTSILRRILSGRLPRDQRLTLWLVGAALLIGQFDLDIFSLALPQIQASLDISEDQVGTFAGTLRLGVLAAFPLATLADTFGRRTMLMFTIIGMTIATGLTAFAQTPTQFLIVQICARCFAYTEEMLCFVVIAEIVAPELRGFAISRLAMLGALGSGLASLLFSQVNTLPHGWRDFYLMGAVGFGLLILARRRLRETERFETLRAARRDSEGFIAHLRPVLVLIRSYPGRFAALVATTIPYSFGLAAAGTFLSKYLQQERGFQPGAISMLYFFGGAISLTGYMIAGPLSDRIGRRTLLAVAMPGTALAFASIYLAPNPWVLAPCWIAGIFCSFAANVTLSAIGSELFPTSHRSTAAAARAAINVLASLAGLAVEGSLYNAFASHVYAILALLAFAPFAIIPMLLFIPETAQRTLESIAPETAPLDTEPIPRP